MESNIFETHYEEYCRQIAELDFSSIKDILGIESKGKEAIIPFLGEDYIEKPFEIDNIVMRIDKILGG